MTVPQEDLEEIRALIRDHFEGMRWDDTQRPDWERFRADFMPHAVLYPAARPAQPKSVDDFVERMNSVASGVLHSFEEHTTGMRIHAFGNIAVAFAVSRMLENGEEENQDVSGYLLVKCAEGWKIAAHAWDKVTAERPVPEILSG